MLSTELERQKALEEAKQAELARIAAEEAELERQLQEQEELDRIAAEEAEKEGQAEGNSYHISQCFNSICAQITLEINQYRISARRSIR